MQILLTGATGFLGSHLLERLISLGFSVICLKRESSNLTRTRHFFEKATWLDIETTDTDQLFFNYQVDCIIHCATDYGRKKVDPIQTIEANLILPLKLLHASIDRNLSIFINTDTILDKRINHYSLSKSQFLDWLKTYVGKTTVVNLCLEHFYGPQDDKSKFSSFIINELIDNKKNSIDLTEGLQKRDFIYIDDVIEAFIAVINNLDNFEKSFYNFEVGSNEPYTIREFTELVKKLCRNKNTFLNFGSLPYRKGEVMESHADTKLLRSLGWKPKVSLENGLKLTIEKEQEKKY